MVKYEYSINYNLYLLNEGDITEEEWENLGSPCLDVTCIIDNKESLLEEEFTVCLNDLKAFMGKNEVYYRKKDIINWVENILHIFRDMLEVENYVENCFLSHEV